MISIQWSASLRGSGLGCLIRYKKPLNHEVVIWCGDEFSFMWVHNAMKGGRMMCFARQKSGCQFPDKLKGKPADCTRRQIKECHGSIKKHPCVPRRVKRSSCTQEERKKIDQIFC